MRAPHAGQNACPEVIGWPQFEQYRADTIERGPALYLQIQVDERAGILTLLAPGHRAGGPSSGSAARFEPAFTFRSGPSRMQMTPQPRHATFR